MPLDRRILAEQLKRRDRLDSLAGRVANVLGVDPERIMYDVATDQIKIPVGLVEQLLDLIG